MSHTFKAALLLLGANGWPSTSSRRSPGPSRRRPPRRSSRPSRNARAFARQKELGVIPANAKLPPRNPRIPAWDSLSADQKKLHARFMEVFAGFWEHTDYESGRLIAHLKAKGLYDNTIII